MRLVLVHGINQQGKDPGALKQEWLGHVAHGCGEGAFTPADCEMPFYGNALHEASNGAEAMSVTQSAEGAPDANEAVFLSAALGEMAQAANISGSDIDVEQRRVGRESDQTAAEFNLVMNRRFISIVRLIEKVSPLHGRLVMGVLKQANAYLKTPGVADRIDAIVRPALDRGPAVVVAHSLGTIITFKLLRQMALEGRPLGVPLYITLGSPLPLMAVQAALGPVFSVPMGVRRWLNGVDPDDFIALGRGLDASSFSTGIENLVDIVNDADNAHSIRGYLEDNRIARAISASLEVQ